MGLERVLCIEDLRRRARRRLPRILFDWVDGGAEDERGIAEASARLAAHRLVPRYLRDVSTRSLATRVLGRSYALPIGIGPTGYTGLLRPGGEAMLAAVAVQADIPYVLSGVSVASIEALGRQAPQHTWFQLYPAHDPAISLDLVRRARDAGLATLVVTADMPIEAKRERDLRNGFRFPLRYSPRLMLDGLAHPAWTLSYLLSGGLPTLGSWATYAGENARAKDVATFYLSQKYPQQTWAHVEAYRRAWPGRLVIKGLLHADDARRAVEVGADGILVSNHGARQLDRAPAAIDALPAIRAAVGDRVAVMMDGGVRRGADVAVALALGADFVFLGRAPLYGVIADGQAGASRAIEILSDELSRVMAQLGLTSIGEFGPEVLAAGRETGGQGTA